MSNHNTSTTTRRPGLKPLEVAAGAGAAVVTAVASSYLGTAGTLTGAALASVVGTVSTSVLRTSADRSAERLRQATARLREQGGSWPLDPAAPTTREVDPYGPQLFGAPDLGPDPDRAVASTGPISTSSTGRDRTGSAGPDRIGSDPTGPGTGPGRPGGPGSTGRSGLTARPRWIVLGVGAVIAFAVSLVAITGIEAAAGKPLAALVGQESGGGTTIGRATGTGSGGPNTDPSPSPSPTSSTTSTSTGEPTATGSADPVPSGTGDQSGQPTATATTVPPASEVPATSEPAPTHAPTATPNPLTGTTPAP